MNRSRKQFYREFLAGMMLTGCAGFATVWWAAGFFMALVYAAGFITPLAFAWVGPRYVEPDAETEERNRGYQ